jgi:hypothetical protein
MIIYAPWFMPNMVITRDLKTPTIREEICCYRHEYSAHLGVYPNDLVMNP